MPPGLAGGSASWLPSTQKLLLFPILNRDRNHVPVDANLVAPFRSRLTGQTEEVDYSPKSGRLASHSFSLWFLFFEKGSLYCWRSTAYSGAIGEDASKESLGANPQETDKERVTQRESGASVSWTRFSEGGRCSSEVDTLPCVSCEPAHCENRQIAAASHFALTEHW